MSFSLKTMLSLWNVLGIVGIFGFACCSWATPSSRSVIDGNVRRCYSEMLRDSDISHLLLDNTTPEKIGHFCSRISTLKKCIAKFEDQLSNSENANFLQKAQGISTFYLNVCPPGTSITEKYKSNAHCFQLIKTKILSCGSNLPDMSSYKMKNDLTARCCALKKHRDCMKWAAFEKCGKEAEEVMEEILIRYFLPQIEGCTDSHLRCQQDIYSSNPTSKYPTSDDMWPLHVDSDHPGDVEDWSKTTVAEGWKKHKAKHGSGGKVSVSFWSIVGCLVVLLLYLG